MEPTLKIHIDELEESEDSSMDMLYQGKLFTGVAFKENPKNGQLILLEGYYEGHSYGCCREWYQNGQLWYENYLMQSLSYRQHGPSRRWYPDGKLESESYYEVGYLIWEKHWNKDEIMDGYYKIKPGSYVYSEYQKKLHEYKNRIGQIYPIIDVDLKTWEFVERPELILEHIQNEFEKKITGYNEAIQKNSDNAALYYQRGLMKYNSIDFYEAIPDFTKAIELDPTQRIYYYDRGKARQDYTTACLIFDPLKLQEIIEDYTQVLKQDPSHYDALLRRGIAYCEVEEFQKAIADFTKAISLKPTLANGYYHRGYAKYRNGDNEGAAADYTKAIEINPDCAPYNSGYNNSILEENLRKSLDEVIQDYGTIVGKSSNDMETIPQVALARYALRGLEEAIRNYSKVLLQGQKNSQEEKRYYQEVIKYYTQILTLYPDQVKMFFHRATAYFYLKKYKLAIADYTTFINHKVPSNFFNVERKSHVPSIYAYYYRGKAKQEINDLQGAVNDYSTILEKYPNHSEVFTYIAELEKTIKNLKNITGLDYTNEE